MKRNQLKAINTPYANHLFRSRLEARWAVYFDEMNTSWKYEEEGFDLKGIWYLPDFYLTSHEIYAEVKPTRFTEAEHKKCLLLCELSGKTVIELVGRPSMSVMNIVVNDNGIIREQEAQLLLYSPKPSYTPLYYHSGEDDYTKDTWIQDAIRKASEARFEFQNK
jgi:hypothetical protein